MLSVETLQFDCSNFGGFVDYTNIIFLNIAHNKREKARNASLIIRMDGPTTEITDPAAPNEEPRKFTFDYSYWSHDGFEKNNEGYLQPTVPHYADQARTLTLEVKI